MKSNVIEVTVSGMTQTGKSAVLAEIYEHLKSKNMAVVFSDRSQRNNPPDNFEESASHEKPHPDSTVIVLNEKNYRRS